MISVKLLSRTQHNLLIHIPLTRTRMLVTTFRFCMRSCAVLPSIYSFLDYPPLTLLFTYATGSAARAPPVPGAPLTIHYWRYFLAIFILERYTVFCLPGHGSTLHLLSSSLGSVQRFPPFAPSLSIYLILCWVPLPQDLLHLSNLVHSDHWQLTTTVIHDYESTGSLNGAWSLAYLCN